MVQIHHRSMLLPWSMSLLGLSVYSLHYLDDQDPNTPTTKH